MITILKHKCTKTSTVTNKHQKRIDLQANMFLNKMDGVLSLFMFFASFVVFVSSTETVHESVEDCVSPQPQCPENEILIKCKYACPPDTCNTLWTSFLCIANQTCEPGCRCAQGYLRTNSTGVCIPEDQCLPPECANDPNAVRGCGNRCGKTCADYNNKDKNCSSAAKICKLAGCDCKPGYIYDENIKKCVKPADCTPQCTKPHEKYIVCLIGQCVTKTCDQLGKPILCPRVLPPCPGGCICETGYLRDRQGNCIKTEECPPPKCDKHANFTLCADPCPATCAYTLPLPCKAPCRPKCQCNKGYVLNTKQKCVKIENCADQAGCNSNQTWVPCNVNCGDAYCPEDDLPQPVCDAPNPCPGGCHCKPNYRLNNSGQCILASECPSVKCTRPNEVWSSCPLENLAENCSDKDKQSGNKCKPKICNPKCICQEGHYRNETGTCVPKDQCPGICKDPNAHWKICPNGPDPCPATCQHTLPLPCDRPCTSGCQCNDGYVLSKPDGICVKIENCPDYADCRANETFVSCNHRCPNVICPKNDLTILCRPPNPCAGGCSCKPNYRYNKDGNCILASECPPVECTRKNEVWSSCPPENLIENCSDRNLTLPEEDCNNRICNPKCICKKGYLKNNYYECIPECECP